MEITPLFKACVKTIRTRNLALGVTVPELDKNRILNINKTKNSKFIHRVKDVLKNITALRGLLMENRKAYLNFSNHLSSLPQMSDSERDKIDTWAQKIMKSSSHMILELKRDTTVYDGPSQLIEHQDAIIDLVDSYLRAVCKIYSEQKAIRTKRKLEMQKMTRLESEVVVSSANKLSNGETSPLRDNSNDEELNMSPSKRNVETTSVSSLTQEDELTAEEMQMFENENEQLYNELNALSDEVRQIESKVVHITELQKVFTEKVLDQEKDIERIFSTVVGSTENMRDANTQIRQAIQSNAGLRVYVLFFLLVMSLSLLFLDWYND